MKKASLGFSKGSLAASKFATSCGKAAEVLSGIAGYEPLIKGGDATAVDSRTQRALAQSQLNAAWRFEKKNIINSKKLVKTDDLVDAFDLTKAIHESN